MRVYVLTSRKGLDKTFKKGKGIELQFLSPDEMGEIGRSPAMVYVDLESFDKEKWKTPVKKLLQRDNLRLGLIDSKGWITDPAAEFHRGVVDILTKPLLTGSITPRRFTQAEGFRPLPVPVPGADNDAPFSGKDWGAVQENHEYLFGFLFIEFDHVNQLKTDLGQSGAAEYSHDFYHYVSEYFAVWDGYLWIRNDFGALYLFPFDGKKLYFLEAALELNLNADIMKFTRFRQKAVFRQAVHIGKTIYRKRGDTGDVVSDTINSLFHLGSKWTNRGSLLITEEVFPFLPASLRPYFRDKGDYEGRKTWQLRDRT